MAPVERDRAKAWTCVTHIIGEVRGNRYDTSEGFILTVDDKMYWSRLYESLAAMESDEAEE